ncbi:MAG: hypothetical protein, partial [Olavius algarvensis Gamma 1 endosymbiont]
GGSPSLLTEEQLIELDVHLQTNLYLSAKAVAHSLPAREARGG